MATINQVLGGCNGQAKRMCASFDKLSREAADDLASLMHPSSYPAKMVLFSENEPSNYIYVVLEGEVKLSMNSSEGKRLILRIARKGEIVGLSSLFTGNPYELTAETLYPCVLACIERREYLNYLMRHPEVYQTLIEELGRQLTQACEQLRTLALSASAPEKLARLLLDWSKNGQTNESGDRFRFSLTHEEVGEFIGTSRETVTRTLKVFKNLRLVTFHGSTLSIPNRTALESYAAC
jgi:CRP/FNR family transcriptional regulator